MYKQLPVIKSTASMVSIYFIEQSFENLYSLKNKYFVLINLNLFSIVCFLFFLNGFIFLISDHVNMSLKELLVL